MFSRFYSQIILYMNSLTFQAKKGSVYHLCTNLLFEAIKKEYNNECNKKI